MPGISEASSERGSAAAVENGASVGPTGVQPPSAAAMPRMPSHGGVVLAFRPACASCMPGTAPWLRTNLVMRARLSTCASSQMPRSRGLIRPSGVTAVASVNTSAAPPAAREPRCTKCQSLAKPSVLEYWHIGETTIRLASVIERKTHGSKRCGIRLLSPDSSDRGQLPIQLQMKTIAVAILGLWAAPALAQPPVVDLQHASLEDLMRIEITSASRKEQRISDTPAAVFVLTCDDIRRSGQSTLMGLLRLVPGVQVARINTTAFAISVRGFNGLYSNKLLVMIDG